MREPLEPRPPADDAGQEGLRSAGRDDDRRKNELVETHVDLAPALDKRGLGHVIAIVEPYPWKESYEPPQHDRVGAVDEARASTRTSTATTWSRSRPSSATGKPAAGVDARDPAVRHQRRRPTTRASRRCRSAAVEQGRALPASRRRGDDVAFVADDGGWWNEYGSWVKQARAQVSSPGT